MDAVVRGNGIKRFATMENGGKNPSSGLDPRHLKPYDVGGTLAATSFKTKTTTVAGTATYPIFSPEEGVPFACEVIAVTGHNTGTGAGTVKVQKVDKLGAVTDVTAAVVPSGASGVTLPAFVLALAQVTLNKGDQLQVVTTVDALTAVFVEIFQRAAY